MGKTCKVIAIITEIIGLIFSIDIADTWGKNLKIGTKDLDMYIHRDWTLTLIIFVCALLIVSIVAASLYAIGEICDNVSVIAFYSSKNMDYMPTSRAIAAWGKEADEEKIIRNGGWRCPDCKRVHYSFETSCSCGRMKDDWK